MNTERAVAAQVAMPEVSHKESTQVDPQILKRAACASFIGNFVEWFDWFASARSQPISRVTDPVVAFMLVCYP